MFYEIVALVQQIDPPQTLVTFLWAAIVALSAAVGVLFRHILLMHDKHLALVQAQYAAVAESNKALAEVTDAIESLERAINLDAQLRDALRQGRAKDSNA